MKRRVVVAASVLSLALPCLLADSGIAPSPLVGGVALAQPASDPITEAARAKYQEGVKAFEAGKYEDARSSFLQAYALKRVPAVLLNLGQSEIKSGHYEDGGNHLQQFIREHKAAKPDEIAAAQAGIADAKKKTGYIIVIVNAVGADLAIDGLAVGKSPLLDPYFAKPGKRVIYATYQGSAATTAVDVKKGIATSATLTLAVSTPVTTAPPSVTAPPTTTAPPVQTSPTPYPTGAQTYPYPSSTVPYVPPATSDPLAPPTATAPFPEQPTGGREPLFDWFKRKPIAWVGAGVTGVGLIFGISFSAAAGVASGNVNDYATQIKTRAEQDGVVGPPCGSIDDPSGDVTGPTDFRDACNTLRESLGQYNTDVALATTFWVLAGVGAVGSVVYAMVDWYPKQQGTARGPRLLGVAPIITPTQGGVGIVGEF